MAILSNYAWDFEGAARLGQPGLLAFVDVTFFGVIRVKGIRLYERLSGRLDVSFPFARRMVDCSACGGRTPYDAPHCIECGAHRYTPGRVKINHFGMQPNVVHPASIEAREAITREIITAYRVAAEGRGCTRSDGDGWPGSSSVGSAASS